MGKASRMKKERKNGGLAPNLSAKEASQGQEVFIQSIASDEAFDALCEAIMADDVDEVAKWTEVFERLSGCSIFDQVVHCQFMSGRKAKCSVILLASINVSDNCTAYLLSLASEREHSAGREWMRMAKMAFEKIPTDCPQFASLTRVMESVVEPVSIEDALHTLEEAAGGFYHPRMEVLVRRVANRYLAEQDRDALAGALGGEMAPICSSPKRI